ncbi:heterokaryon incompatibility protein-domain-containing protein [Xylaria digitata]|nr:heterokaryon incompatibility protein-domain-containing protein [Xylaria digitata]
MYVNTTSFEHQPRRILARIFATSAGIRIVGSSSFGLLDQKVKEIRLIKLQSYDPSSSQNRDIVCELEENLETIKLEKQDFKVTQNLFGALENLRLCDKTRILWIDAICIDQSDVADKNYQVPLMSDIYSRATGVVVWLEDEAPEAPAAFKVLEQSKIDDGGELLGPDSGPAARDNWVDSENGTRQLKSLQALCCQRYWSRVWIIQEVTLATDIYLYCGGRSVHWDILKNHLIALDKEAKLRARSECSDSDSDDDDASVESVVRGIVKSACYDVLRGGMRGVGNNSQLSDLILRHGQNGCKNPMDKVYGLLSLTSNVSIPVDYERRLGHLYLDVMHSCLENDYGGVWLEMANLSECLQRAFGNDSKRIQAHLPSHQRAFDRGFILNRKVNISADGVLKNLHIGLTLDEYRRQSLDHGCFQAFPVNKISPRYRRRYSKQLMNFLDREMWRQMDSLNWLPNGEEIFFARVPKQARRNVAEIPDDDEPSSGSDDTGSFVSEHLTPHDKTRTGQKLFLQPPDRGEDWEEDSVRDLADITLDGDWGTCRLFNRGSLFGVISHDAKETDGIFKLKGCNSIVVLRPIGGGFKLVGRALILQYHEEPVFVEENLECRDMPFNVFQILTLLP